MNLFPQPDGCTCLGTADALRVVLEGQTRGPCKVHDPEAAWQDAYEKREAEARDRELAKSAALDREMARATEMARSEAQAEARAAALSQLDEQDPLAADLARRTGYSPPVVPLNAPLSAYPSLGGYDTDDDGPRAA